MKQIIDKLDDGGPLITVTILILIFVIVALIIKAAIQKEDNKKTISLISSIAWFAIAWGYLGRTFGLIMAFDKVASAGDITPSLMAGGLKMALIGPLMGLMAFIIARVGIIFLTLAKKK